MTNKNKSPKKTDTRKRNKEGEKVANKTNGANVYVVTDNNVVEYRDVSDALATENLCRTTIHVPLDEIDIKVEPVEQVQGGDHQPMTEELDQVNVDTTQKSPTPNIDNEQLQIQPPKIELEFVGQTNPEPSLKVRTPYRVRLNSEPLTASFDIVVRRKNYKNFPIQFFNKDDQLSCPFTITSAGSVTYKSISVPKGDEVSHLGASLTIENTKEILISFNTVSTALSRDEREKLHIRMHFGKQWELVCLSQQDGSVLGTVGFKVVWVPRLSVKKQTLPLQAQSIQGQDKLRAILPKPLLTPNSNIMEISSAYNTTKNRSIQKLQEIIPSLSINNLDLLVKIAELIKGK